MDCPSCELEMECFRLVDVAASLSDEPGEDGDGFTVAGSKTTTVWRCSECGYREEREDGEEESEDQGGET